VSFENELVPVNGRIVTRLRQNKNPSVFPMTSSPVFVLYYKTFL